MVECKFEVVMIACQPLIELPFIGLSCMGSGAFYLCLTSSPCFARGWVSLLKPRLDDEGEGFLAEVNGQVKSKVRILPVI